MISLVVPTHNRAYALVQVLDTFYLQESLSEIVFVDDCSTDNTKEVIEQFKNKYPKIITTYLRNSEKSGASFSRLKGVNAASSEYILFCDDDEFMELNYTKVCLRKLQNREGDIISGRHFYRNPNENISKAIERFGIGISNAAVFGKIRFKVYTDAKFTGDMKVPFTHGIFMTTKKLLNQFQIDPFYSKGNGFREESDFQLNAFLNDHIILMTNETHCVHMNMSEVRTGGQRVNRLKRFWYNIYYTHYFLRKYYPKLQKKILISYSLKSAITLYTIAEFYDFFIRPFGIVAKKILGKV
ncbi:MAG: glycosyltransferase family 2 protein [Bacteriovorax sp.]|nr:glycosyltransferase family 2 protein [Bacteriovorax sp.]